MRGFDLANITFLEGDTDWIGFDPHSARQAARAALQLIKEKLGKRPVLGVVHSHPHVGPWAGARSVVDEADVARGKVMAIGRPPSADCAVGGRSRRHVGTLR